MCLLHRAYLFQRSVAMFIELFKKPLFLRCANIILKLIVYFSISISFRGKVRDSTLEFEGVHVTQKTVLVADSQKAYIKKILILKDFLPKNQCFVALIPRFDI